MCKITKELEKPKTVNGYKLVIKYKGEFYSPSTGLKYSVGMTIPKMKKLRKRIDGEWSNPLNPYWYEERMQGKTGIFLKLKDMFDIGGICISENHHYSIVKMKLGNVLYEGNMDGTPIYIGNDIQELKEVYTTKELGNEYADKEIFKRVTNK